MELSLRYEDNDTGHDDLVLRIGGESWACDSYYLALDQGVMPGREEPEKVRAVLRQLLGQWLAAVEALPDGGTVYLPYDFSDQYTGWLACLRAGDAVAVSRGWAEVGGWSFSPSAAGDLSDRPRGFRVDGPAVRYGVSAVVEAIRGASSRGT